MLHTQSGSFKYLKLLVFLLVKLLVQISTNTNFNKKKSTSETHILTWITKTFFTMYLDPKIQKKPRNPFMYYSSFKLAVYYNDNKTRCQPLHSKETKTTIAQLIFNKVDQIILDKRAGYHFCIEKCEILKRRIFHARLYSAYNPDLCYGIFVDGKWIIDQEPQFTNDNTIVISKDYSVKNGFAVLHDIEANTLAIQY